jgi:hypothetical protein
MTPEPPLPFVCAAGALAEAQRCLDCSDHVRGAAAARAAWEQAAAEGREPGLAIRAVTLLLLHLQRSGDDEQTLTEQPS